jgi:hypothetical protein
MTTLARRVFESWRTEGVAWDHGVDDARLDEIERAHSIRLPASFRELWRLADGTVAPDRHWLIFVQASDLVQPLYAPRTRDIVTLMFADWRQAMATFSLQLVPNAPDESPVVVIGNMTETLAPSFDAFLRLYIDESVLWRRTASG